MKNHCKFAVLPIPGKNKRRHPGATENGAFGEHVGRLLPTIEVDWYRNRAPYLTRDIEEWLAAGNPLKLPYASDPFWSEDIHLRSIEITGDYDACTLILCPDAPSEAGEWKVWLRIVSEYYRYETLPDYMDYVTEKLG